MIFCARATRGLRRVGREPPDRPSCSQNAHDNNGARPMRAVKGNLAYSKQVWQLEGPRRVNGTSRRASGWAGEKVARSGRSISPHPWRDNERAWREHVYRSMRAREALPLPSRHELGKVEEDD